MTSLRQSCALPPMAMGGSLLAAFLLLPLSVRAGSPNWWLKQGALRSSVPPDDYAVANQGQAKALARKAWQEMEDVLPWGAGGELDDLVSSWDHPTVMSFGGIGNFLQPYVDEEETDDYAALTQGQLKTLALPFYERLWDEWVDIGLPWSEDEDDDDPYAVVTIGQLKQVFSFPIPDWNSPAAASGGVHGRYTENGFVLSWSHHERNADTHRIQMSNDGGITWSTLGTVDAGDELRFTVSPSYYSSSSVYRVHSENSVGGSDSAWLWGGDIDGDGFEDDEEEDRLHTDKADPASPAPMLHGPGRKGWARYQWSDSGNSDRHDTDRRFSFTRADLEFRWQDISGTGERLDISDYDEGVSTVDLPFPFSIAGKSYKQLHISCNGLIAFDAPISSYSNGNLHSLGKTVLAPFWDDLNPSDTGNIYFQAFEDRAIVQFSNVVRWYQQVGVTFQVVLRKNGVVHFYYKDMRGPTDRATIGVYLHNDDSGFRDLCRLSWDDDYLEEQMDGNTRPFALRFHPALKERSGKIPHLWSDSRSRPETALWSRGFRRRPEPAPFHWQSIQHADNRLAYISDREYGYQQVAFQHFRFPIAGHVYNRIYVSANGLITFEEGYAYSPESDYGDHWGHWLRGFGQCVIAPLWDDFNMRDSDASGHGDAYFKEYADRVVVEFHDVGNDVVLGERYTFQVVLHASGRVEFLYKNLGVTDEATAGIYLYNPELGFDDELVLAKDDTGSYSTHGNDYFERSGNGNLAVRFDLLLPVDLKVDYDRDGEDDILGDSGDSIPDGKYYRFWVNNDHDFGNDAAADDDPAQAQNPSNRIGNKRDLEDYVRLHVNLSAIKDDVKDGTVKVGFRFLNSSNGVPRIDIYPSADTDKGSDSYLFDNDAAAEQLAGQFAERIASVGYNEISWLAQSAFQNLTEDGRLFLIFDGANSGKGDFTMFLKWPGQESIEAVKIPMQILDVRNMYEHWTAGDSNDVALADIPRTATKANDSGAYGANSPEDEEAIVFVHGWRMKPEDRRRFADTSFKRLWQQGYNGRFYHFSWPTEFTEFDRPFGIEAPVDRDNYQDSEEKAYHVGRFALLEFLQSLNQKYPGKVRMFAHSMGGIVASEALRSGAPIHTYAACQTAMAGHAYDPSLDSRDVNWDTPEVYGQYPPTSAPYYAGIAAKTFNFHNGVDAALIAWESGQNLKPFHGIIFGADDNEHYHCDDFDEAANTGQFNYDEGLFSAQRDLNFPDDTYEIFAHCAEARSIACGKGGVPALKGNFDIETDFSDDSFAFGAERNGHSGQFLGTNMIRHEFWEILLGDQCFGFQTLRTKRPSSP